MANKCSVCGGRGLELFEGGFAGFCRQCYGFGIVIDAPVLDFCNFGFFSLRLEEAWENAMDVTYDIPVQEPDHGACQMVEE